MTTPTTPAPPTTSMGGPALLRVHGHHSLLTGVDAPAVLLERARRLGWSALALADVDSLAGLVDFLRAADRQRAEHGERAVRPIVAAEVSDPSGRPGRLVALVRTRAGYGNLCRLVTERHLGGDWFDGGSRRGPHLSAATEAREEEEPAPFDLVESAVRHADGLTYLVDHPRLLLALFGRVPAEQLFAAVSPAALALARGPLARWRGRTSERERRTRLPDVRASELKTDTLRDPEPLEPDKTPPPARAVDALELCAAARATGAATLAVPDVWYAFPGGARDHRLRAAIRHNALLEDLPEEWLAPEPAHVPGTRELAALYAELPEVSGPFPRGAGRDLPGSVARTRDVAAACTFRPELDRVRFPEVALAPDETPYSRLVALAFEGAGRRYRPLRPEVVRRLDRELGAIETLGFAAYFLLVEQIADFARERAIPCVGRGSAADSLVSYCLGLTDADPLRYDLPFERFLNPARKDRPDIDLDFCWRRRDEVLEHVYAAFGGERTAMICTLACFGLRSAFRETALAHGLPPAEIDRWSRRLPWHPPSAAELAANDPELGAAHVADPRTGSRVEPHARPHRGARAPAADARNGSPTERVALPPELALNPLARALFSVPECRGFPFDDARWCGVLRDAAELIDTPRHFGLHPGGVVVSPGSMADFVPCQRAKKGVVVTQLDKDAIEAVGLVKMDLLGNRALTVLDDCVRALAERGVEVDLQGVPEDDAATAMRLREGRTLGCFQVESPGMRHLLQQIGAHTMDDVIQAVALIRPGPASSGMKDAYVRRFRQLEEPTAPHPRLVDLLWDTHGVMLYQEDVMQVVARLAGMDLAEADLLRRALSKRRGAALDAARERFLAGCAEQGVERADAARVWELVANFASFGFCKAHAVTYGRIAYRAVYLKEHYPAEYLTAFLASDTGYYAARVYVEEARRLGVPILGPDVNRSEATFALERRLEPGGATTPCLRLGLGQVKGLSADFLARLFAARAERGPFLSLPDLLERARPRGDEAEALIRCGALDAFDRTRTELLWRLHLLRSPIRRAPRPDRAGRPDETPLDRAQLDACHATPASRAREADAALAVRSASEEALAAARARNGGWSGRGLGVDARSVPTDARTLGSGGAPRLFPEPETPALVLPGLPDLPPRERGLLEYELLGVTLAAHPTRLFRCAAEERLRALREQPPRPTPCLHVLRGARGRVTLRGWLAASRRVRTTSGRWMRFLTLEDESGLAEVVVFPEVYRRDGHLLVDQGPFLVTGTVEDQMGARTLHAERIW